MRLLCTYQHILTEEQNCKYSKAMIKCFMSLLESSTYSCKFTVTAQHASQNVPSPVLFSVERELACMQCCLPQLLVEGFLELWCAGGLCWALATERLCFLQMDVKQALTIYSSSNRSMVTYWKSIAFSFHRTFLRPIHFISWSANAFKVDCACKLNWTLSHGPQFNAIPCHNLEQLTGEAILRRDVVLKMCSIQ